MRATLKSLIPLSIRRLRHHPLAFDYSKAYEQQAKHNTEATVVGDGDYHAIGAMQLELLRRSGLEPHHTLLDFGCGNGRLAAHAIPFLNAGHYIGIDHCKPFLQRAKAMLGNRGQWIHQVGFAFPPLAADMFCAFSVFTHMEHEDTYRYLMEAKRVVKPGGVLVFSCLPLNLKLARELFLHEAREPLVQRWSRVRNIVTSRELMETVATMAGWSVESWLDGDEKIFNGDAFGQSACTLRNH